MTNDAKQRKETPIARGVLDYFPHAIAEVAHVSYVGNQQHNPGQEMHWAKEKSRDHADCIARHLIERGTLDSDGLRHSAKVAWRALALLQIEIESSSVANGASSATDNGPRTTDTPQAVKFFDRPERERDFKELIRLGCPDQVARLIAMGTTYAHANTGRYAYVAGPMRGIPGFNFAAFDAARDELVKRDYNVISPADIDRAAGDVDPAKTQHNAIQADFAFRDFWALYFLKRIDHGQNAIVLLRNWERSTGANAEHGIAKWLGLRIKEIGECVPSSSATCTNPSAIPATSASAKTCASSTAATR